MTQPSFFKTIENTDELLNFLQTRKHDYYYHFTTVSKLVKILESRRWRFSTGALMNDQHEYNIKSAPGLREKIFSTCFSFGDKNNMAMWAMYSIPWEEAVRIRIPGETMREWVEKLKMVDRPNLSNVSLHDILYIDGRIGESHFAHFYWSRAKKSALNEPDGTDVSLSPRFTGHLKNSAWKHEQEARLAVTLQDVTDKLFYDFPLPDNFFSKIQITTGPWTSDELFDLRKQQILDATPVRFREKLAKNIKPNSFRNQIHLRRHCDICKQVFKRK